MYQYSKTNNQSWEYYILKSFKLLPAIIRDFWLLAKSCLKSPYLKKNQIYIYICKAGRNRIIKILALFEHMLDNEDTEWN